MWAQFRLKVPSHCFTNASAEIAQGTIDYSLQSKHTTFETKPLQFVYLEIQYFFDSFSYRNEWMICRILDSERNPSFANGEAKTVQELALETLETRFF